MTSTTSAPCRVRTMSPKAFRLVDQLSGTPEKSKSSPKITEKQSAPPAVSAHWEKETAEKGSGAMITDITPLTEEAMLSVTLLVRCRESTEIQRHHICLLLGQFAVLKPTVGEVTMDMAEALLEAGRISRAIQKGMELLGYGAMSRRRLVSKLTARGFEPDLAEGAADYLEEKGYLSEDDAAIRFAEQGLRKLWGPRRIREDLFARGFAADVVAQAMEELASVDFGENCALVISKKYGSVPEDPGSRRKMVAALMRLGYTSEHIREAMRQNH